MYEAIKQWEYRVRTVGAFFSGVKAEALEELLNEWGEDGWEVVAAPFIENQNKITVIAKRPLTDQARRERSRPSF
jgi:hypothetical protein